MSNSCRTIIRPQVRGAFISVASTKVDSDMLFIRQEFLVRFPSVLSQERRITKPCTAKVNMEQVDNNGFLAKVTPLSVLIRSDMINQPAVASEGSWMFVVFWLPKTMYLE